MTDTTPQADPDAARKGRFLELREVAKELNTSENQIYALVRRDDLEGVESGGRGQWRVESDKLTTSPGYTQRPASTSRRTRTPNSTPKPRGARNCWR